MAQVAKLDQISEADRLDPEQLIAELCTAGPVAEYLPDVESIVGHITTHATSGDIVCVFSNGGFGGIHQKLLDGLKR